MVIFGLKLVVVDGKVPVGVIVDGCAVVGRRVDVAG